MEQYEISTIFFGGGTPSILAGDQIAEILRFIYKYFRVPRGIEISIEGNPGTLTMEKLQKYYDCGINRLSIGLQACQNRLLEKLGRIHNYKQFLKNLEDARDTGFTNINADLMFALPGQRIRDWEESLKEIVNLQIPHISAYSLIVEEGTPFAKWIEEKVLETLDEEIELEMYHMAIDYLNSNGYTHYEISNFAKPNYQCKHNINYWKNMEYIGLGAGAHSLVNHSRFHNTENVEDYIKQLNNNSRPVKNIIQISRNDEISETMFLGLRLIEGVYVEDFIRRFGMSPFDIYRDRFKKLKKQDLLDYNSKKIWLTDKGIDLSNVVFQEMLLD